MTGHRTGRTELAACKQQLSVILHFYYAARFINLSFKTQWRCELDCNLESQSSATFLQLEMLIERCYKRLVCL